MEIPEISNDEDLVPYDMGIERPPAGQTNRRSIVEEPSEKKLSVVKPPYEGGNFHIITLK